MSVQWIHQLKARLAEDAAREAADEHGHDSPAARLAREAADRAVVGAGRAWDGGAA